MKIMTEQMQAELVVEHDELISQIGRINADEYMRSSDASETAAKTKEYLEMSGLNSQALSWAKTIMKKRPKKDGDQKAMDVIRSLKVVLPMLENEITGQSTPDMLDAAAAKDAEEEVAPLEGDAEEESAETAGEDGDNVTPIDLDKAG